MHTMRDLLLQNSFVEYTKKFVAFKVAYLLIKIETTINVYFIQCNSASNTVVEKQVNKRRNRYN